jgi:hypothetical protein
MWKMTIKMDDIEMDFKVGDQIVKMRIFWMGFTSCPIMGSDIGGIKPLGSITKIRYQLIPVRNGQ